MNKQDQASGWWNPETNMKGRQPEAYWTEDEPVKKSIKDLNNNG